MTDEKGAPAKGASAWGQAVTAVVLVGVLAVGLWTVQRTSSSHGESASPPATCSGGRSATASTGAAEEGATDRAEDGAKGSANGGANGGAKKAAKAPRQASGLQLCEALNRPDLADLLGTPGETAKSASGSDGAFTSPGGHKTATPSARVEFGTYTVNLAASYDRMPVTEYASLLGAGDDARRQTVLGRTAVLYADRTLSISFRLDGSDSDSRPGVPARSLAVALDAKDSGGSFEFTLWRTDGGAADDAALLSVARKVLPTIPGWTTEG